LQPLGESNRVGGTGLRLSDDHARLNDYAYSERRFDKTSRPLTVLAKRVSV